MLPNNVFYDSCPFCSEIWPEGKFDICVICENEDNNADLYHKLRYRKMLYSSGNYDTCIICDEIWYEGELDKYSPNIYKICKPCHDDEKCCII